MLIVIHVMCSFLHTQVQQHLEEYLGLASLPVVFSSKHSFTNALAAFLFAFLLNQKQTKDLTKHAGKRS